MRSYYAHLETAMGKTVEAISPKPTFRSSAIFPVFHQKDISSRILFMGYWMLKRNIQSIGAVVTLRSLAGALLSRMNFQIQEAKTYRLEVKEMLEKAGIQTDKPFEGSMEVEFYSNSNMVFPFPATVINYYGPAFSTVVHTAQRVYNDYDDLQRNSQTAVPESGFNIYADEDHEPFLGLINGPVHVKNSKIRMQFYNHEGKVLSYVKELGDLAPYQTNILYPARETDLKGFLMGKVGACKVNFDVQWIFPRLVVGNLQKSLPALSITHSYYDCTKAETDSDYWKQPPAEWYTASLMIPVTIEGSHFTNVYFYPIYSPSIFTIDVEFYDKNGTLLGKKTNIVQVKSPDDKFIVLHFKEICRDLKISPLPELGARIIAKTLEGSRLPARVKLGLDMGVEGPQLPCNICTNLQPFNPPLEAKPKSFKWAPFLAAQPHSSVWLMNSSPHVNHTQTADVDLTFFREKDATTLNRTLHIPPQGFTVIYPDQDAELAAFFENQIGWCTATTNNPYLTTYYFSENASGVVGGDHGF